MDFEPHPDSSITSTISILITTFSPSSYRHAVGGVAYISVADLAQYKQSPNAILHETFNHSAGSITSSTASMTIAGVETSAEAAPVAATARNTSPPAIPMLRLSDVAGNIDGKRKSLSTVPRQPVPRMAPPKLNAPKTKPSPRPLL